MQIDSVLKRSGLSESHLHTMAMYALSGYCLCFALSIALSQIFIISFIVFVAVSILLSDEKKALKEALSISYLRDFYVPLLCWISICIIGIPVSLDPGRSFVYLLKFAVYLALPFCIILFLFRVPKKRFLMQEVKKYMYFLFLSQALAAVHTIISTHLGYDIKPKIPGALTESGQIVLLIPLFAGFIFLNLQGKRLNGTKELLLHVLALLFPLVVFSWYRRIPIIGDTLAIVCGIFALVYFLLVIYRSLKHSESLRQSDYFERIVPVLAILVFAAFLFNLKRGPWFAGIVEIIIFGYLFSRSLMAGFLFLMFSSVLIPPVYERIASFAEHFYIGGGRFDMWKLGFQLMERFPIGVGFANSNVMRDFDPSLPFTHRHMHNNVLNIAVETGILGAVMYLWWMLNLLVKGFSAIRAKYAHFRMVKDEGFYAFLILLAITGWQLAGVVEYNFGDGEIRMLAFVLFGFLLALLGLIQKSSDFD